MGDEVMLERNHPKGRYCQVIQSLDQTRVNKEVPIHTISAEGEIDVHPDAEIEDDQILCC